MTGDETDGRADADDRRPNRDRDDGDEDGGFVFGSNRDTDAEPRADSSQETEVDSERRIRVDLQSSESDDTSRASPPGRDPDPLEAGPDPGPNAVRNWTVLLFALSLASLATAAVTYTTQDDLLPVVGATVLGLGFGALASIAQNTDVPMLELLSAGWIEHRRYTWFATGLFAVGIIIGALLLLLGVDLLEFIIGMFEEELFPGEDGEELELTATFFIVNNSGPFLLSIVGALSLGLLTAVILLFNGIIVGNFGAAVASMIGLDYIVVGLAPHGVFELAALFLAAGVGFRLIYRLAERILDKRESFLTKPYAYRTVALVGFAWLLLVLAAFVEAYVTPELLEMLFAERLEQAPESAEMP